MIIYNVLLYILAFLLIPKVLYNLYWCGKYRSSLKQRLGVTPFPELSKKNGPILWVHSVSVGETKAVAPLASKLKKYLGAQLLVTTTTESGQAEARRSMPMASTYAYLPLDLLPIIRKAIAGAQPKLLLLSESDFWFNFLSQCKEAGSTIVLVNGKISERSMKRFLWVKSFTKRLFAQIDLFCVQNQLYAERFEQLGVPSSKIQITGNLKLDNDIAHLQPEEELKWRQRLGIESHDKVMVLGSTHAPEEEMLLDQLDPLMKEFPDLKILIVPRHPERFSEVHQYLLKHGISCKKLSELNQLPKATSCRVILIDAMGVLRQCYQIATIAIVAGSFTKRLGGHNIIEPCHYGVPVLFGPYMHTQMEFLSLIQEYDAGIQVPIEQVGDTVKMLLSSEQECLRLGQNGLLLVHKMHGATERTLNAILNYLKIEKTGLNTSVN